MRDGAPSGGGGRVGPSDRAAACTLQNQSGAATGSGMHKTHVVALQVPAEHRVPSPPRCTRCPHRSQSMENASLLASDVPPSSSSSLPLGAEVDDDASSLRVAVSLASRRATPEGTAVVAAGDVTGGGDGVGAVGAAGGAAAPAPDAAARAVRRVTKEAAVAADADDVTGGDDGVGAVGAAGGVAAPAPDAAARAVRRVTKDAAVAADADDATGGDDGVGAVGAAGGAAAAPALVGAARVSWRATAADADDATGGDGGVGPVGPTVGAAVPALVAAASASAVSPSALSESLR